MVNNTTKYCLKGLPIQTEVKEIQTAFSDKEIHISNVRRMTKLTLENETIFAQSHTSMGIDWYSPLQDKNRGFKQRQTVTQCLRCQAFGHKAPFCRLIRKCRLCAELHNTRECPNRPTSEMCWLWWRPSSIFRRLSEKTKIQEKFDKTASSPSYQ